MLFDLITLGDAFEDWIFAHLERLPQEGEEIKTNTLVRMPGGGAVRSAIAAARLGLRCAALVPVSAETEVLLKNEGVRVINLRKAQEPPAISVALSTQHERTFVTFNGANQHVEERALVELSYIEARHLHVALQPTQWARWAAELQALRTRGISVSWDFGYDALFHYSEAVQQLLNEVDFLMLNQKEALLYSDASTFEQAKDFWKGKTPHVVIKRGALGAEVLSAKGEWYEPAEPVTAVDTTGAGDAFNGGFLVAILAGYDVVKALRWGHRVAARAVQSIGCIKTLPRKEALL